MVKWLDSIAGAISCFARPFGIAVEYGFAPTMGKSFCVTILALVVLESVASYRISSPPLSGGKNSGVADGGSNSNKTITDDTLRALLGKIKDYMTPVQPLPDEQYFTNSSILCANVSSLNAQITDLTVYTIDVAHADMSKLEFTFKLTFPVVNASGLYHLYVEDDIFVLRGHGNFSVNLKAVSLSANLTLALNSNKTLEMKDVASDFDFTYAHVNFENLGEDKDVSVFLNDLVNQFIVESMKSMKPTMEDMAKDRLMGFGRFLVQGMTLDEFIDFINGLV